MKTTPHFLDRLSFATVAPRDWVVRLLCVRYETFVWGFSMMQPRLMAKSGQLRARRASYRAARRVPAYRAHLLEAAGERGEPPETDKELYIKRHPTEARCSLGALPLTRTMIDESSGSTGTPYNWVRSRRERLEAQRFISYFAKYCYGTAPRITINAFPWAPGPRASTWARRWRRTDWSRARARTWPRS